DMRKALLAILIAGMAMFMLAACGNEDEGSASNGGSASNEDEPLKVVTSFTIIADLVRQIGGDDVEVYNLVPTGTDRHEYESLADDNKKSTDADILFYN